MASPRTYTFGSRTFTAQQVARIRAVNAARANGPQVVGENPQRVSARPITSTMQEKLREAGRGSGVIDPTPDGDGSAVEAGEAVG
jgi:hypothetical protein